MRSALFILGLMCGVLVARVAGEWGVIALVIAIILVVGFVWITSDALVRRRFSRSSEAAEAKGAADVVTSSWRNLPAGGGAILTASWLMVKQGFTWGLLLAALWGVGQVVDALYSAAQSRERLRERLLRTQGKYARCRAAIADDTMKELESLEAEIEEAERIGRERNGRGIHDD